MRALALFDDLPPEQVAADFISRGVRPVDGQYENDRKKM